MLLFLDQPIKSTEGTIVFDGLSVESIAPDPSEPDDLGGGAALSASISLGDSAQFQIEAMADHKEPIESWSGSTRLTWHPVSSATIPWARVELASVTAQSVGPSRLISLAPGVQHPLQGSLHLRLATAIIPQAPFQVSYLEVHAIDAQTSTASIVEEQTVTLDAQGAWTWRDYRFQVIRTDSAQAEVSIQKLAMKPAHAVAGNGAVLPVAAQSSWHTLTTTMKAGDLPGLEKLCSNSVYQQLAKPSTQDKTPSQSIVERGMKWERLAPTWTLAGDTEIRFQLGSQAPFHLFSLAKQDESWKLATWQLVTKP